MEEVLERLPSKCEALESVSHQQTEAHARNVKHALSNHKAHREKQV